MKFIPTKIKGVLVIQPELVRDHRGFFGRIWDSKEFASRGLKTNSVQTSVSFNKRKGTLRGLHFQAAPYGETKFVRCTKGAIYDVVVDLRPASRTYLQWVGVKLNEDNHRLLYIPKGCAHGFQTLVNDTEVYYEISPAYVPKSARGIRWNDPVFSIRWPLPITALSSKDKSYPDFLIRK